jgi:hypothetical protein
MTIREKLYRELNYDEVAIGHKLEMVLNRKGSNSKCVVPTCLV